MTDELDFDADELAMLRQLFRTEAQDALERVTAILLESGLARPAPALLTEMMRATHTLKGSAGTVGLPAMVELAHRLEDVFSAYRRDAAAWTPSTGDLLVEVIDALRGYVDHMNEPGADAAASELSVTLAELARGGAPARPADTAGDDAADEDAAADDDAIPLAIADAPDDVENIDNIPAPIARTEASGPIDARGDARRWLRVDPEKIDELMSGAGELLFDRTRIERRVQLLRTLARDLARSRQRLHDAIADAPGLPAPLRAALADTDVALAGQAAMLSQTTAALLDEIEALRRTIGGVQRGLIRARMESAQSLMTHAARTLRALRRATGVSVELRAYGEDTEFDKAVAERLVDPITQLLRNAVAHGIEPPDERAARGKPALATIAIRARQDAGSLVLEVSDDGRGVDTDALARRLVATGRWSDARARLASEADVLAALLDTNVSSRGEADELAGRGVGLGVVRQTVARLGGALAVASSPGKGTSFTLRVPLSTTLAQAMLFKVDGQVYAIPQAHIVDTTLVDAQAQTAIVHHDTLPVLRLEQLLGAPRALSTTSERKPALVMSFAGKRLVCTVDKIIGAREIIIKPLGPLLAPLTLYAGATISGSGKVQLILDSAQLVRRAYPEAPLALLDPSSSPHALAGRALVVDDSRAIREAMTSMLGSEGWIVDVAEDGARAQQLARQVRYDLVVTDLEMPALGGFELIARLRQDERYRDAPIVVITSRASPDHRRRARELGVQALVAKPITRRKLLEALAAR